jgi:hypothetical protein
MEAGNSMKLMTMTYYDILFTPDKTIRETRVTRVYNQMAWSVPAQNPCLTKDRSMPIIFSACRGSQSTS